MPKILIITLVHFVLFAAGGVLLGFSAFGLGFSGAPNSHHLYNALLIAWEVLNAPSSLYVLHATSPNWALSGLLQAFTSFLWANLFAFVMSTVKACRHNKPLKEGRAEEPRAL